MIFLRIISIVIISVSISVLITLGVIKFSDKMRKAEDERTDERTREIFKEEFDKLNKQSK